MTLYDGVQSYKNAEFSTIAMSRVGTVNILTVNNCSNPFPKFLITSSKFLISVLAGLIRTTLF